ncbi:hypothetical protein MPSEU_000819500 [Mayamaea pseudoterrestris]|nr:hypothetical protein MPSEU_000819500 [Mayamaea pseudoterrestris]
MLYQRLFHNAATPLAKINPFGGSATTIQPWALKQAASVFPQQTQTMQHQPHQLYAQVPTPWANSQQSMTPWTQPHTVWAFKTSALVIQPTPVSEQQQPPRQVPQWTQAQPVFHRNSYYRQIHYRPQQPVRVPFSFHGAQILTSTFTASSATFTSPFGAPLFVPQPIHVQASNALDVVMMDTSDDDDDVEMIDACDLMDWKVLA